MEAVASGENNIFCNACRVNTSHSSYFVCAPPMYQFLSCKVIATCKQRGEASSFRSKWFYLMIASDAQTGAGGLIEIVPIRQELYRASLSGLLWMI